MKYSLSYSDARQQNTDLKIQKQFWNGRRNKVSDTWSYFYQNIYSVKKFGSALDKLLVVELLVVFWNPGYIVILKGFFTPFYSLNVFPEFLLIELNWFFLFELFCFLSLHPDKKGKSNCKKDDESNNSKGNFCVFFWEIFPKNFSKLHKPSINIRKLIFS